MVEALHGVRVLDVSDEYGTFGGRLLADLGADVVRLEPPGGSPRRRKNARMGLPRSLEFSYDEAGKRSVVVDEDDRASFHEIASRADVLLLSRECAREIEEGCATSTGGFVPPNWVPRDAVVIVTSPFGLTGPLRDWRATSRTSDAMAGLMIQHGTAAGPPLPIPSGLLTAYVGVHTAIAALAALRERDSDGAGRVLDLSAHEVLASMNLSFHNYARAAYRDTRAAASRVEYGGVWSCRDGLIEYLASTERQWQSLVSVLGSPAALSDGRLADRSERLRRTDEVENAVACALAGMERAEFVERAQASGLPAALVNSIPEFVADVQPRRRRFFVPLDLGDGTTAQAPGLGFAARPPLAAARRRAAPEVGSLAPAALAAEWARPSGRPSKSLRGIRVLSFGTVVAGGLVGSALADLGADVVKIESPVRPDPLRTYTPPGELPAIEPTGAPTSTGFQTCNRSSSGIAMDMTEPAAVELFLDLVRSADVLIDNFSPHVREKWGLSHDRVARENPGLVQLSISGYGQSGPRSNYSAYGSTVCSFVGLTHTWGSSSQTLFDYVAHAQGLVAVLAALRRRDLTGEGTIIDLAMTEAAASVMGHEIVARTAERERDPAAGSWGWSTVVGCLGEDAWIAVEVSSASERHSLASIIGIDAESSDEEIGVALADWAAQRTALQSARRLQSAGVPAARVQTNEDVFGDPQLRHRRAIVEIAHPDLGVAEYFAPIHGERYPSAAAARAPRLGEHGDEVVARWLGASDAELRSWRGARAYRLPEIEEERR